MLVSGVVVVVVVVSEATGAVDPARYTAGWTLTAEFVLSDQRTNTPVRGAAGEPRKASQHAGVLPSGVWPTSAPKVVAA
jgi:hypothetical protein